ncbi:hypothetical protein C0993_006681 [Termitomyces sp. T159_Od127]|nr:hypothetical protein C0993_006681 [Termitomyces sp. T159_Od127]
MERVQFQQEQMLDELKDLVEKRLFTEKEVKHIVKKRTAFETALVRRVAQKADFLRYASYEMGLEQLRRKRAARTKSESTIPSISDYALVRRQFQIFERALKKFKSDVALWVQYIQVAQREGARALVGRISARALQLHPNKPALYILAASHELNHQSPSSARTILQRGIRLNAESVELWREYAKMELGFIENLRRRWEILGINATVPKADTAASDPSKLIMPGVDEALDATEEPIEDDGAEARKEILQGAIVKSVMDRAAQALPKLELFETLKTLVAEYPSPSSLRETLLEHLYKLVKEKLPGNAGAIRLRAGRFLTPDLKGEALVEGLRQANEELLEAATGDDAGEEVCQVYATFVEEWCNTAIDGNMKQYLISTLRLLCQQKRKISPSLLASHIRVMTNLEEGPAKVLGLARKYSKKARSSAPVWLARLEAEKRFGGPVGAVWKEARSAVIGSVGDVEGVWTWGLFPSDAAEERKRTHEELLKESMRQGLAGLHETLLMSYVRVLHEVHGTPGTGLDSDQGAGWLESIRHMASAYLTSGAVWRQLFAGVQGESGWGSGPQKEVLGAVYREWEGRDREGARRAWGACVAYSRHSSFPPSPRTSRRRRRASFLSHLWRVFPSLYASPSPSSQSLRAELMLQYPVQLPPLSLSASPKIIPRRDPDFFRPNDLLNTKRLSKDPFSRTLFSNLHSSPTSAPISLPRSPRQSDLPLSQPWLPSKSIVPSRHSSVASSTIEDVLFPGDFVGQDGFLQGEKIRLVLNHSGSGLSDYREPAQEFQVKRRLGHGSYAVVYLVQEVLYRPQPSEDGHTSIVGMMELDNVKAADAVFGREYAIKCLSKANLDGEDLAAQMSEVNIHQSLRSHPNIVTLHRTLETSSFLLLLLEYVPGEDLFYFLEQARDHFDSESPNIPDFSVSHTPPTPSLLSTLHPAQLLSRTRLRLISSMFSQMCDAVAACHDQSVFHRDIKPENFIVTDGWTTSPSGRQERKVIVKLSDFGLSTTDVASSDMDCGSAPYMSYECRNNIAPTYRPRAADVWSLGIVLINMLYHSNPWTDTAQGACSSFDLYRRDPINFFMHRFSGMTRPVAEHLANKVFCILEDPEDDSPRISAREFGIWVRQLPSLLGSHTIHRTVSNSSQGHPIASSTPLSHRPSSRHPSGTSTVRSPAVQPRILSRAPSLSPAYEAREHSDLSTVYDHEPEPEEDHGQGDILEGMESRSTSTHRRRKRGARKGKGASTPDAKDETLATLADASQSLAREISRASRSSSTNLSVSSRNTGTTSSSRRAREPFEPVSLYAMPTALLNVARNSSTSSRGVPAPPPPVPSVPQPPVVKKPSKWKLSFGKNSASALAAAGRVSPVEEVSPSSSVDTHGSHIMSTTATNVTNLIMGLDAPPPPSSSVSPDEKFSTWGRGRRDRFYGVAPSNASNKSLVLVSEPYWERRNSVMDGVPWELDELPRGQHPKPVGDIFGSPPVRKQRTKKNKDVKLDTITERPQNAAAGKSLEAHRRDASTSTTDLGGPGSSGKDDGEGVKKVQRGQINALAKMLSALRR